jgi:hypothetical protein
MNIKKLKKNILTSNILDAAIVIILILSLINQTNFFRHFTSLFHFLVYIPLLFIFLDK